MHYSYNNCSAIRAFVEITIHNCTTTVQYHNFKQNILLFIFKTGIMSGAVYFGRSGNCHHHHFNYWNYVVEKTNSNKCFKIALVHVEVWICVSIKQLITGKNFIIWYHFLPNSPCLKAMSNCMYKNNYWQKSPHLWESLKTIISS